MAPFCEGVRPDHDQLRWLPPKLLRPDKPDPEHGLRLPRQAHLPRQPGVLCAPPQVRWPVQGRGQGLLAGWPVPGYMWQCGQTEDSSKRSNTKVSLPYRTKRPLEQLAVVRKINYTLSQDWMETFRPVFLTAPALQTWKTPRTETVSWRCFVATTKNGGRLWWLDWLT